MKYIFRFLKNNYYFVSYMISMTLLLYLRDVLDVSISKNIFVILGIGFSIFAKYYNLLPIIMFTLPLMCGLPGNFFLPVWCCLILRYQLQQSTVQWSSILFVSLFAIWELLICSIYPFQFEIMDYIGYISALLLLCILVTEKTAIDYSSSIIAFLIGCCVLLVCSYLIYLKEPSLNILDSGVRMGGDAYVEKGVMSLHTNANNIGYLSAVAISISFTLFYYKMLHLTPFLILLGSSFYCGMFAVSRTWAISVVLCFILYFLFQQGNKKVGYAMFLVLSASLIYFLSQNEMILQVFIERFTGDNIETGGQRTTLFTDYNKFLFEHTGNLIFGTSAQLYKEVTNIYNSTHNGLQQIWLSYGIIGFVIFISSYIRLIKANWTPRQYMACLPMLITFLFLQTIQVLNPHNGLYPLIVSFFMMKAVKGKYYSK